MYEQHFKLDSRPFTLIPLVEHYFPSSTMQKSIDSAKACIERGTGPVVVISEPGNGKSLLLAMLERTFQNQFNIANVVCSKLDKRQELLQNILFELQLPFRNLNEGEMRLNLKDFVKSNQSSENGVLLLVDEGHNLTIELLDEIRLMTQIVRAGVPRVRVVLAGSFRLEESLADPRLASLNQLVASRCYLSPLTRCETAGYVVDHIDRVGGHGKQIFDEASLRQIHDLTEGCPRTINQLCDHALMLAANHGRLTIDQAWISDAWADLQNYSRCTEVLMSSSVDCEESFSNDHTIIEYGSLDDDHELADDQDVQNLDVHQQPWEQAFSAEPVADQLPSDVESSDCFETEVSTEESWPDEDDGIPQATERLWQESPLVEVISSESNQVIEESDSQIDAHHHHETSDCDSESIDDLSYESSSTLPQESSWDPMSELPWDFERDSQPHSQLDPEHQWQANSSDDSQAGTVAEEMELNFGEEVNFDEEVNFGEEGEEIQEPGPAAEPIPISARDPFAEEFEDEEIIQDRYAPLVAAYNRSSLSVTPSDLDALIDIQHSHPVDQPAGDNAGENAGEESNEYQSNALLEQQPLESDLNSGIESEAESFIQRMYESLGESPQQIEEYSAEGDIEPSNLESVERDEAPSFSPFSFAPKTDTLAEHSQMQWNLTPAAPEVESSQQETTEFTADPSEGTAADDRDIIVCDISDLPVVPVSSADNSDRVLFPSTPVSTGKAQRMDYQELFDQLRNLSRD